MASLPLSSLSVGASRSRRSRLNCFPCFGAACRETWTSLWGSGGYSPCDGVRALAMLWVCFFHATAHTTSDGTIGQELYSAWWPIAVPMSGDAAVDLFLVLSGFLLGTALYRDIKKGSRCEAESSRDVVVASTSPRLLSLGAWGRFYLRRWFRIAPGYISSIIVSTIFDVPISSQEACLDYWWANLLFINNYYPEWDPMWGANCMVHSWSIAVEVQLYVATPPIFLLASCLSTAVPHLSPALAVSVISGLCYLTCCFLRLRFMLENPDELAPAYIDTQMRMSSYLAGLIAAMAVQECISPTKKARCFLRRSFTVAAGAGAYVVIVLTALVGADPLYFILNASMGRSYNDNYPTLKLFHASFLRPLFGAASAYLLARSVTNRQVLLSKVLSAKFWRPLAALSYSMYLLQYLGWRLTMYPMLSSAPLLGCGVGDSGESRNSTAVEPALIPAFTWMCPVQDIWRAALMCFLASVLAVLGTIPLAFLNFLFFERPFMNLGKWLMTRDKKPSAMMPLSVEEAPPEAPSGAAEDERSQFERELTAHIEEVQSNSVWVEIEAVDAEDDHAHPIVCADSEFRDSSSSSDA